MITLPTSIEAARAATGSFRAGGTDLQELRHKGLRSGPVVDLRDVAGLSGFTPTADGGLRIGAATPLAVIAADPTVRAGYRAFADAAAGLATPQIRARATIAGSLLQEVRCWYFRSPEFHCLKKGGAMCFARGGDAIFHSCVDLGPCIAPHPSTMAGALWAFDGTIEVDGSVRDVPTLLGDGSQPAKTHALEAGGLVTAVYLPPPVPNERSAYHRTIHRARAEWPIVEATVRTQLDATGALSALTLTAGGVANRPLRFDEAARACLGLPPSDPRVDAILAALGKPASSLPQSAWKAGLIPATLRDTLDLALEAT